MSVKNSENASKHEDGEWEYFLQEWRWSNREEAESQAQEMEQEGWERDGTSFVWAGMYVDRYGQKWRRKAHCR